MTPTRNVFDGTLRVTAMHVLSFWECRWVVSAPTDKTFKRLHVDVGQEREWTFNVEWIPLNS